MLVKSYKPFSGIASPSGTTDAGSESDEGINL
jgi:hypothetical protein